MDNTNWRSSSKNQNQNIFLGKSFSANPYGRFTLELQDTKPLWSTSLASSSSTSSRSSRVQNFLKKLRKKFRKEKKSFGSGRSNPVIVPYNSYTYSQNFDDLAVTSTVEPDNLSRSFSARFASSSTARMFTRVQSVR